MVFIERISLLNLATPLHMIFMQSLDKRLPPDARRALAEAEARRKASAPPLAKELNGRKGLEPTRYGDWESRGIASDF